MRAVYCDTLIDLAQKDERIMVVEADLMRASGTTGFQVAFPNRTVDVGVAEANMIGVCSGLSAAGKIPFAATFGCFASRRVFDQFFISANYTQLNVKLVGTDPGISAAFNGGTHMPFEDIGMMKLIPNLTIFEPSDPVSLESLLRQSASHQGCTYMRLHRKGIAPLYDEKETFTLGKGKLLRDGNDVTIIAIGAILVPEAIRAAKLLNDQGVSAAVIDMHTIKPLDEDLVLKYAKKTGSIVTAENHQVIGGLGASIASFLAKAHPTRMAMVGIQDEFGQVGTQSWLQEHYKLTAEEIVKQALSLRSKS